MSNDGTGEDDLLERAVRAIAAAVAERLTRDEACRFAMGRPDELHER